jgi:hypothetical protein
MEQHRHRATPSQPKGASRGGDAAACSFLRHLLALGRSLRIYAHGHGRVHESVLALRSVAEELLFGRVDDLDFVVEGSGLRFGSEMIHSEPAVTEAFAKVLRVRGIRALVIRSGIERAELFGLAELLGRTMKEILLDGGLEASLCAMQHPHFDLLPALTDFREEGDEVNAVAVDPDAVNELRPNGTKPVFLAASATFDDLLGNAAELPATPCEPDRTLVYTAFDGGELELAPGKLADVAEGTLRDELLSHDVEHSAAIAVFDMLRRAGDELEYRVRRDLVCDVVRERRLDVRALRFAQMQLVGDMPDWPHEDPATLLLEFGAIAGDTTLLENALGRSLMPQTVARDVAEQLSSRPDALDSLSTVLRASLPEKIRNPVEDTMLNLARDRKPAFRRWALEYPSRFLHRSCFSLLLRKADMVLGPIAKEFFAQEDLKNRDRMIDMLVRDGGEKALRLLLVGVKQSGELCDPQLIAALGKFEHATATDALREVIVRCNTERFDREEASCAIRALSESGTDEAFKFLEEVARGRRLLRSVYKRPLRELAQEILELV